MQLGKVEIGIALVVILGLGYWYFKKEKKNSTIQSGSDCFLKCQQKCFTDDCLNGRPDQCDMSKVNMCTQDCIKWECPRSNN